MTSTAPSGVVRTLVGNAFLLGFSHFDRQVGSEARANAPFGVVQGVTTALGANDPICHFQNVDLF